MHTAWVDRSVVKDLSKIEGWRFTIALALDVALIAAAIAISEHFYFSLPLYLFSVVVIGSRLHAFAVLAHETAHWRAFKNRRLNDIVGEPLAWMILFTLYGYRKHHLAHHSHLNSDQDPDWVRKKSARYVYPAPPRKFWLEWAKYAIGYNYFREMSDFMKSNALKDLPPRLKRARMAFYVAVVASALFFGFGRQLLMYWFVPLITWFSVAFYLRTLAEHHGRMEYDHTLTHSRNVYPTWWERWLFVPHNVNLHLDHHLYPGVPFYRLRQLHRALLANPEYCAKAHITHGYLKGMIGELIS